MADTSVRKDFVDGVHEIFTTLFNNGSEKEDGVFLYLLSEKTTKNVYGERKRKIYQKPKLLVCKAVLTPTQGEQDTEGVKNVAEFVVTLKSLQENNLGVTDKDLDTMRRGVMKFHNTFYLIDNIVPKAYIEDVFLMYTFQCTENKDMTSITLEENSEGESNE